MRKLLLLLLLAWAPAHASLEQDGTWQAGVWATTVWADGVWLEGESSGCTNYPTLLAGLSPAAASGDIIDADELTTNGKAVTIDEDGTYCIEDNDTNGYFVVRYFDDSTGDWHVMSRANGFRVYIGGTVRLDDYTGDDPATTEATLDGLGINAAIVLGCGSAAMEGEVLRLNPPTYSLVASGQAVEIVESRGVCSGGGKLRLNLKLRL